MEGAGYITRNSRERRLFNSSFSRPRHRSTWRTEISVGRDDGMSIVAWKADHRCPYRRKRIDKVRTRRVDQAKTEVRRSMEKPWRASQCARRRAEDWLPAGFIGSSSERRRPWGSESYIHSFISCPLVTFSNTTSSTLVELEPMGGRERFLLVVGTGRRRLRRRILRKRPHWKIEHVLGT